MSAEVKTAVLNEAFELSHMFRENAALKHGLPRCPSAQRIAALEETKQEPPVVNITNNIPAADAVQSTTSPGEGPAAASVPSSSLFRAALPWLLTAVGAGGIAAGANYLMQDEPPAPIVQQVEPKDGSLLQWLQDSGKHLPEDQQWQTK